MSNVVVVFRMATVGSIFHILPCGILSTFYIANLHSQTTTHTEDKSYQYELCYSL